MARRGRKKLKDLVDMLEEPEDAGYVGGDYEDAMDLLEDELEEYESGEGQEVIE